MPLYLLTDEQISHVVSDQIRAKRPDISITSVHAWRGGDYRSRTDESLLRAAANDGLSLVTYDRRTIPPLLIEWSATGTEHSGVIFVDELTIAQGDIGGQVLAIIALWDQTRAWEWTNRISFLRPAR